MTERLGRLPRGRHCRHYSYQGGIMDGRPVCALGIELQPKGPRTLALSLPCMPDPMTSCLSREEFTDAELTEKKRAMSEAMKQYFEIVHTIPPSAPGTSAELPCVKCGGTIQYAYSQLNGHLTAICSTPNCFAVME